MKESIVCPHNPQAIIPGIISTEGYNNRFIDNGSVWKVPKTEKEKCKNAKIQKM